MDFLNKLLHRGSTSEGAGSPQSGEARDSRGHNRSEIYLNNKNLNDAVSPSTTWTRGKFTEDKSEGNEGQKNVQNKLEETFDLEEEDQFEDAQENKLSLTFLAENLNKVHLTTPGRREVGEPASHEFADDIVYGNESLNFNSSSFYESFDLKSGEQSLESSFMVTTTVPETPSQKHDRTVGEYEYPESRSPNTTAASTVNNSVSTNESCVSIINKESTINITAEEHSESKISELEKSETSLQENLKVPEIVLTVAPAVSEEECQNTILSSPGNTSSNNQAPNSPTIISEESCLNSQDDLSDFEISISMPMESDISVLSKSIDSSYATPAEKDEKTEQVHQDDNKEKLTEPANLSEHVETTPLNSEKNVIVSKLEPSEPSVNASETIVNNLSVDKVEKIALSEDSVVATNVDSSTNVENIVETIIREEEKVTALQTNVALYESEKYELKETSVSSTEDGSNETIEPFLKSEVTENIIPEMVKASCIKAVALSEPSATSVLNEVDNVTEYQVKLLKEEVDSTQQSVHVPTVEILVKEETLANEIKEESAIDANVDLHDSDPCKSELSRCEVERDSSTSSSMKRLDEGGDILSVTTDNVVSDVDLVTSLVLEESIQSSSVVSAEDQVTQILQTLSINSVENVVSDVETPTVHVSEDIETSSVLTVEKQASEMPETPAISSVEEAVSNVESTTVVEESSQTSSALTAPSVETATSPVKSMDNANNSVLETIKNEEENVTQVNGQLDNIVYCDNSLSGTFASSDLSQSVVEGGINTCVVPQTKEIENPVQIQDTSVVMQTKKEESPAQIQENSVQPENVSLAVDTSIVMQIKEEESLVKKSVEPENVNSGVDTSIVMQTKEESPVQKSVEPENVNLEVDTSVVMQTKEESPVEKSVEPENVNSGVDTSVVMQTKEESPVEKSVEPENVNLEVDTSVVMQTKEESPVEKSVEPENINSGVDTSIVKQTKEEETLVDEKCVQSENISSGVGTSTVTQTKVEESPVQIQENSVKPENVNLEVDTSVVMQTKEESKVEKSVEPENINSGVDTSIVKQTKEEETLVDEKCVQSENISSGVGTSIVTQTKVEESPVQIQENSVKPENVNLEVDTSVVMQTKEESKVEKSVEPENINSGVDTSIVKQSKEEETPVDEKCIQSENISSGVGTSIVTQTKEEETPVDEKCIQSENISSGVGTSIVTQTKVEESPVKIEENSVQPENVSLTVDTSVVMLTKEEESPVDKSLEPENINSEVDTSVVMQTKEEESSVQKSALPEHLNLSLENQIKIGPSIDVHETPNYSCEIPTENVGETRKNSEKNTSNAISSTQKVLRNNEDISNLTLETVACVGVQKNDPKLNGDSDLCTSNVINTSENVVGEKSTDSIKKQTASQCQNAIQMNMDQSVDHLSNKTGISKDKSKEHPIVVSESLEVLTADTSTNMSILPAPASQQKYPTMEFKISPTNEKELTSFSNANTSNKFYKFKTPPKRNLFNDFKASAQNTKESPVLDFFIAGDRKSDVIEFDERVAEEATNISDHILNVSLELQESDSDSDNNKTVISLPQKPSPRLQNPPQPQDSVMQSFMQSMRSVLPAHLNQSEAGPITADELNTHDLEFQDGANLDLDFFNQVGCSDSTVKNSLTRHSLYVKFDPIVNAIVSNTVSDSIKMPPPSVPDQENPSEEQATSDQAAEPNAVEATVDSQKTPMRSPALEAVQKLISLTPPSSTPATTAPPKSDRGPVGTPVSAAPKIAGISQEQLQKELKKLETIMKDREKHFELVLSKKEEELEAESARRAELEAEMKAASERELRLKKEVQERTKSKQQLSLVMEEYEKTISQLVAQKEEDKKEYEIQKDILMKERDTAMQHLNNMEIAFSDVHQKYERSKSVIEGMKANEEMLRRGVAEYDEAIKSSNNRYESLKNHAVKQLETANTELDLTRRAHQAELAKLTAMMKKTDLRVKSLEEALDRKTKENQELAAICDELINKVGN